MADPHSPATSPADTTGELQPVPDGKQVKPGARRALIVLILAAATMTLFVLWPFRTPLFLAVVMSAVLFPTHRRLEEKLKGRSNLSAFLITLGLFIALALPVASVVTFAAREVSQGVVWVRGSMGINSVSEFDWTKLPPPATAFIEKGLATLHLQPDQLKAWLSRGLDWAQDTSKDILGASAGFAFGVALMLVAFYIFLLDGRVALRYLKGVSPLPRAQTNELVLEFRNVTSAAVLGTAVTALVQGALATIGFLVAGVPHAFFLGLATVLASFIPLVGTVLVWGPACAVLVVSGHTTAAIALGAYSAIIVSSSDNVVKPLVMKGKVALDGSLVLLALLGGVATFGLVGIILGPLALSFLVALLRIYRRDYLEQVK